MPLRERTLPSLAESERDYLVRRGVHCTLRGSRLVDGTYTINDGEPLS